MDNPFADFGNIITGDRFIGRDEELRLIRDRILSRNSYGSLAVVGMPRCGKTSLIMQGILEQSELLRERNAVAVRLEVGSYSSLKEIFSAMINKVMTQIRYFGFACGDLWERAGRMDCFQDSSDYFDQLEVFFRELRRHNIRPVCVLDEFDAGRYLFAENKRFFHWLRELGSNPHYRVALVIISKRQLHDIARIAGFDSKYWYNTFMCIPLREFDDPAMECYLGRLASHGVPVSQELPQVLDELCGRHPFLLDLFSFYAVDSVANGNGLDLPALVARVNRHLWHLFNQIYEVMVDGPYLSHAVQILLGPQYDVSYKDVEDLVYYGLLRADDRHRVGAFVPALVDYLRILQPSIDFWPLWKNTEQKLRTVLGRFLHNCYGDLWEEELRKSRPRVAVPILDNCRSSMQKEESKFGRCASSNILDYTYPYQLFQTMCCDWDQLGQPLLGGKADQWATKFQLLAKVRTPLAHNRPITIAERHKAEEICKEILDILSTHDDLPIEI